jgi:probable HAF family extracellular repeat protein
MIAPRMSEAESHRKEPTTELRSARERFLSQHIPAMTTMRSNLVAVIAVATLAALAQGAAFRGLGDLPGGKTESWTGGVSADGQVVVGQSASSAGTEAFRWTAETGMVGLGDLPGGIFYSEATGISADGMVIAGRSSSTRGAEAFRWTTAAGMVPLGDLPGGRFASAAYAVSADGSTVVGESASALSGEYHEAFRCTAATGLVPLGDLPGGDFRSDAQAVSADGSVVVGSSVSATGWEAYRWTETTGMVGLGDFPGGYTNSLGFGVSADGSVVVGRGYSGVFDLSTHEAFRWTAQSGLVPLGFAPGDDWSIAYSVSDDGNTIVGDNANHAIIWDPVHQMRLLRDVLITDYGLDLTGWQLTSARSLSADGNTIAGSGVNPTGQYEAWVATGLRPTLTISRTNDTCWLSWPVSAADFTLQSSEQPSSGWSNVSASLVTNANSVIVSQGLSARARFYRLVR